MKRAGENLLGDKTKKARILLIKVWEAIQIDGVYTLDALLIGGASLINAQGQHAIHVAAVNNALKCLDYLIRERNVSVQLGDNNGWTALHVAAANGHIEAIGKLKDLGAEVNAKDNNGWTALHVAARNGQAEAIEKLKGRAVNAKNNNGATALHVAAEYGQAKAIEKLKDLGANIDAKDNNGWTALHAAAANGHVEAIGKLRGGANINAKDEGEWTALHFAARNGHVGVLEKLKKLGADIGVKNNNGWAALHVAAANGHVEVLEKLKKLGAEVNAKDNNGNTALHFAAGYGHIEAIERLKKLGADINAKNNNGWTALHVAAGYGHAEAIEKLKMEVNINAKDNDGWTALHFAALNGKEEVVRLLAHEDADVNAVNSQDLTPLRLLVQKKNLGCFKLLLELGGVFASLDAEASSDYNNWAKVAEIMRNICLLKSKQSTEVLTNFNEKELTPFMTNVMSNYLIKHGIKGEYRVKFEEVYKVLPKGLQKSLLSYLDELLIAGKEQLGMLDAALLHAIEGLGYLPYNILLKQYPNEEQAPDEERKLLEFYDNNPEYKTPGNYFLDCIGHCSEVYNISELNYRMIVSEDIKGLVIDLNKCVLPSELKHKLSQIITKYKEYKNDLSILTMCNQQEEIKKFEKQLEKQEKITKGQEKVIEEQGKTIEKQQKELNSLKAYTSKMVEFFMNYYPDFAMYMRGEQLGSNIANDNYEVSMGGIEAFFESGV